MARLLRPFLVVFAVIPAAGAQTAGGPLFPFEAPWAAYNTSTTRDGGDPVAFATGDLDGDGDPDVVAARGRSEFGGSGFYVLRNDGRGRLSAPVGYAGPSNSWGLAVADLDGDGDLDVAVSNGNYLQTSGNTVSVYPGNGDGTFGARRDVSVGTGAVVPVGLAAADFDGDGDADLAVAAYGVVGQGSTVRLLRNDGAGGFAAPVAFPAGNAPYKVVAGDLTGDGRPDVVASTEDLGFALLRNDGAGGFLSPVVYEGAPGSQNRFSSVAVADAEGDGDLDVFAPGLPAAERGRILVYRNDGSGVLVQQGGASFPVYTASPWDLAAADLTGDGRPDLLGAHYSGRVSDGVVVAVNDGSGGFGEGVTYPAGQGTYAVAAADMDADGDADVLTADDFSMAVTVRLNAGAGAFPTVPLDLTGAAEGCLDAADVEGDGDLDLFTSCAQGSVLRNDGMGRFGQRQTIAIPFELVDRGVLRDLNGDGRPDLLFNNAPVNNAPYDFYVSLNDGTGTFPQPTRVPVGSCGWGEIDAVDLDNDGDLDVVDMEALGAPGCDTGRFFVALNDGDGTFGPPYAVGGLPFRPDDVAGADYDEDGDLDLAMTGGGAYGYDTVVMVVLGRGDGTFGPPTSYTVARGPADILAADLDADGHLDLAVTSRGYDDGAFYVGEEKLTTLFGTGAGTFGRIRTQYAPFSPDLQAAGGVQAGDVDADGDLDLMTSGGAANDLSLYVNDGAGLFSFPYRLGTIHGAADPYYADFTGDGVPDLAVTASVPPPIPTSDTGVAVLRGLTTAPVAADPSTPDAGGSAPFAFTAVGPNPTSGAARLTLSVGVLQTVRVEAFDALGRRVAVIHDGALAAGPHTLAFDASALPAGLYVVRARAADGATTTRRLVVR